jgi:cold shock CspA family protein/uncharacterized LabA/DUF88 family protein
MGFDETSLYGNMVKIGVFYDGNFLFHVSNYYSYHHERRSRISIDGMHQFIKSSISDALDVPIELCQVVESHYFRGRVVASDTSKESIYKERLFEDVLIREGVVTHYLPVTSNGDKSTDLLFVLEAFEAATVKKLDVIVLVAIDGSFVPLVRKINAVGVKTMLVGCDFEFVDENGTKRTTRTSSKLINEVCFPVLLNDSLENNSSFYESLFIQRKREKKVYSGVKAEIKDGEFSGVVQNVLNGYGFITPDDKSLISTGENLFFHFNDICTDPDCDDIRIGDRVKFEMGENEKGVCAKSISLMEE